MDLRRTPFHEVHVASGARFTEFGGWEMPLRYGSIIEEHRAVREAAGLFDLSHMGELWVEGAEAGEALAAALVNEPARLPPGRAGYSLLCTPEGGVIDDLIVYHVERGAFLVVPNASNREVVREENKQARIDAFSDQATNRNRYISFGACLEALQPAWDAALAEAARVNVAGGAVRRGVGYQTGRCGRSW